jgi:peptidoglycan/LPS O-acetylase OafA/YrhL
VEPILSGAAQPDPTAEDRAIAVRSGRPRGDFQIPSLDGLRAISFLIVFVAHAGLTLIPGAFGVTVFFFLSGYLITTLLRLEHSASGAVSLRDFYLRRALRILPPFYLVLALSAVLASAGLLPGAALQWRPMLALAGHFTNYWAVAFGMDGQPAGTGVYWSLAVEEHFYLVFPFLFILLQRFLPGRWRIQAAVLLGLCAAVLAWRSHLVFSLGVSVARTFFATDTRVDSILFGCALALGANPMLDRPRLPEELLFRLFLPLGAALLGVSFAIRAPWFRETLRYSLQGVGLAPVFIVAMRAPRWGPFGLLNLPLVKRVGVLSYSLYLVHQVVLFSVEKQLGGSRALLRGILALAIALALAEGIQRFVERPCARIRRRLAHADWLSSWPAVKEREMLTASPAREIKIPKAGLDY